MFAKGRRRVPLYRLTMDKLTLISGTLFMAADVFAIVSLAMPDWIITDVGGTYSCNRIHKIRCYVLV
jgi:hypothetical protein